MALTLPTFTVGRKARATELAQLVAALNALTPLKAIKTLDESLTSNNTLQNDDALFLAIAANTSYWLDLAVLAQETTGATADIKFAWTMPTGCKLDATVVGPHVNWANSAAQLEAEWVGWQNEASSPTSAKSFGASNGLNFSYHVRGVVRNGANAGTLQLQWAQNASVAEAVTVKAGSSLMLTPLP